LRVGLQIQELQADAQGEADRIPALTQEILDVQTAQKAYLASIDAQIASAQASAEALSKALSAEETAAVQAAADDAAAQIVAAQDAAKAEIATMRASIANEIVALGVQENILLNEQQARLIEQKEVAEKQLVELVGAEEAAKLLSEGSDAQIVLLAGVQQVLEGIDGHLLSFLDSVTAAVSSTSEERSYSSGEVTGSSSTYGVNSSQGNAYQVGRSSSGDVNISVPSVTVNLSSGSQEEAVQAGVTVYKTIRDYIVEDINNRGVLSQAISDLVDS